MPIESLGVPNKRLRRAVSTAYYALFHLLTMETAKNWKRPAERFIVARMFDHAPMVKACSRKRDELNRYFNMRPRPGHDFDVRNHLRVITNTFVDMLQHRHTADYDGAFTWSRTDVLEKIESVNAAFQSWRQIRDEDEAQNFLVTLLLKER